MNLIPGRKYLVKLLTNDYILYEYTHIATYETFIKGDFLALINGCKYVNENVEIKNVLSIVPIESLDIGIP